MSMHRRVTDPAKILKQVEDLENLSKPALQFVEADERAGESGEGVVDVASALVACDKPAKAVDPGEGALDDPPMAAQLLADSNAPPRDAWSDPATAAGLRAASMVEGFIGVEFVQPTPSSTCLAIGRRDAVERLLERHAVVGVYARQEEGEIHAVPVGGKMTLRAEPASIGWVRLRLITPFWQQETRCPCTPGFSRSGWQLAADAAARGAARPRHLPPASPANAAST